MIIHHMYALTFILWIQKEQVIFVFILLEDLTECTARVTR